MKTIEICVQYIQSKVQFIPEVAIVLGSGLGDFAETINKVGEVPYSDIPGFPQSTVTGHEGKFIFGYVEGIPAVIMQGRVHYYEGYAMNEVVLPIRVMYKLGAKKLILTNAAGGVNPEFKPGDFMIITDHISSFIPSPLRGKNFEELGTRFPDMSEVYNHEMVQVVREVADECNIKVQEGVYIQLEGPSYETPAEIRMVSRLGADAVGMSTVCEAMVANHMGMKICGISCITNMACGLSDNKLNHEEVKEIANIVAEQYKQIIGGIVKKI